MAAPLSGLLTLRILKSWENLKLDMGKVFTKWTFCSIINKERKACAKQCKCFLESVVLSQLGSLLIQFCPSLLTVHHGWENHWAEWLPFMTAKVSSGAPKHCNWEIRVAFEAITIVFGTGLFLVCSEALPQEPTVPCYEQFVFLPFWLPSLITVFPYWRDSEPEHWEIKRYRVGCCSWPNYSHLIALHPIPPHPFPQILATRFKTTA